MGLLDIFKPGWKRYAEWAVEDIKNSGDPNLINRILTETDYSGNDRALIESAAINRLWSLKQTNPEVGEYLEKLARESQIPLSRCQAAYFLYTKPGMKKIIADNIIQAYKDPNLKLSGNAYQWIRNVDDKETVIEAYNAVSDDPGFRKNVLGYIKDQSITAEIVINAKSESAAADALNHLIEINGSEREYERIISKCRYKNCTDRAVSKLGINNPVLAALAEKNNHTAVKRLADAGNEEMLVRLADQGDKTAANRLAEKDLKKYADPYFDLLDEKKQKESLFGSMLSQATCERIAMDRFVYDASDPFCPAVAAACRISDPDTIFRLMTEKGSEKFRGSQDRNAWCSMLVGKITYREDLMWKLVTDTSMCFQVREAALSYVNDPDKLEQIARNGSNLSLPAAKKLPAERLAGLRTSQNSEIWKYAEEQEYRTRIGTANEAELLQIMEWFYRQDSSVDLYLKALDRLETQEGLCRALGTYLDSEKCRKENNPWKPVGAIILARITDGPRLAAVCLDHAEASDEEVTSRLRELISGTEDEDFYVRKAAEKLMEGIPMQCWRVAALLRNYFGMENSSQALWKCGGEKFIQRILDLIETEPEIGSVKELASLLQGIYQSVPVSQGLIVRRRGRSYKKHFDSVGNFCAADDESRYVEYIFDPEA